MRAWQVCKNGEPEVALQLLEVDPPQPDPDEVQIRVETVAPALPDVFLCRGVYPQCLKICGQIIKSKILDKPEN